MKANYKVQRKFSYSFLITITIFANFLSMLKLINFLLRSSSGTYIDDLAKNWSQGPITDIKLISQESNLNCSTFNMMPLLNDYWSGTVKGCRLEDTIVPFQCHFLGNLSKPIDKVKYRYWNGFEICASRKGMTLIDLKRTKKVCPIGYKSCGKTDNWESIIH